MVLATSTPRIMNRFLMVSRRKQCNVFVVKNFRFRFTIHLQIDFHDIEAKMFRPLLPLIEITLTGPKKHSSFTRRQAIVTGNKRRGRTSSYLYENQYLLIFAD